MKRVACGVVFLASSFTTQRPGDLERGLTMADLAGALKSGIETATLDKTAL
jgi:hypothetical protein